MTFFLLNGAPRELHNAEPGRTVLDHLRLHERLTATKEGCAEGDCGACTVVVGRPENGTLKFSAVNSCIMLAASLDGCAVVTAEGLAANGALAPVQQAMVELHGSQCGFCTPGFVMSLYAHTQNVQPNDAVEKREALLDALAGNLCRCTGYRPILAAAEMLHHAPDERASAWAATLAAMPPDAAAPRSLAALDALLAANPNAKLVGGTTDLGVGIAKHGKIPENMVLVRAVEGLDVIEETQNHLLIGASATYSEILPYLQTRFPNFAGLVRRIGSVQIRNTGTMGGNLCNASPIGDSAPCLIALDAILVLRSVDGEREIAIEDFFTGYRKTALRPGEYLRAIKIPYLKTDEQFFAYKLAKRFDQDISTVAAAFKITIADGIITGLRAGFGGMAATPLRVKALEDALKGRQAGAEYFEKAAALVGILFTPLSDFRATAAYRRDAAAGFILRLGVQAAGTAPADIWAL
jgi:xanthine dehydrogenase small subunit